MLKQHVDSTREQNENLPTNKKLSNEDLLEDVKNGDTAAVRAALEKLSPGSKTERVAFEAVHEACRGNHDECLALLLPYSETTQMGFGILLSECVHADHTACTEVLLQHWKSYCRKVAYVRHDTQKSPLCPAMWEDPAVCQVFIDAGADIETKNDKGCSPLQVASRSGALTTVKMLVEAGANVVGDQRRTCLMFAAVFGHTDTVRYLAGLPEVDLNREDINNHTALHLAVKYADVVQVLIDAGADIETKDGLGRSPLHVASFSGELTTMTKLVEAGADVRATDSERYTCLMFAAVSGHTDAVRYLAGLPEVDLNQQSEDGHTALHFAVERKHPDVVQVLINMGTDIETKNDKGHSPLHEASISGELTTVKMLVEAGADVRATDSERTTCLMFAAHSGHTDAVRYLAGLPEVELNQQSGDDRTALHVAVERENPDVVQVLIDAGANIEIKNDEGRSPLHVASFVGEVATMTKLVRAGADVCSTDSESMSCLMFAAHSGQTDAVRYLAGLPEVDLDQQSTDDRTALHFAVEANHPDVVQVLIDAGANIEIKNDEGRSPLHLASFSGELTTVKLLVEAGADVRATDAERDTCLILAAYSGHTDTVRYLAGLPEVELNQQSGDDSTALHFAVEPNHPDVVQVLIDAGADLDAKNGLGHSPLHMASISGELTTMTKLVRAGADLCTTDPLRRTCLMFAAHHGHTNAVRYLAGLSEVDLNQQSGDKRTALYAAVMEKHTDVVQVLIDAGADIDAKDGDGRSPLFLASCLGELTTVTKLVKAGADVRATDSERDTCLILAANTPSAAHSGHTDTVRYLAGLPEVDLNQQSGDGHTALHFAVERENPDVVQVLIDAGANIEIKNNEGRSPLQVASFVGEVATMTKLVEAGAERNQCLMFAAFHGNTDVVRYLAGLPEVDLNQQSRDERAFALYIAMERKHADVVQVLIEAEARQAGGLGAGQTKATLSGGFGAVQTGATQAGGLGAGQTKATLSGGFGAVRTRATQSGGFGAVQTQAGGFGGSYTQTRATQVGGFVFGAAQTGAAQAGRFGSGQAGATQTGGFVFGSGQTGATQAGGFGSGQTRATQSGGLGAGQTRATLSGGFGAVRTRATQSGGLGATRATLSGGFGAVQTQSGGFGSGQTRATLSGGLGAGQTQAGGFGGSYTQTRATQVGGFVFGAAQTGAAQAGRFGSGQTGATQTGGFGGFGSGQTGATQTGGFVFGSGQTGATQAGGFGAG